MAKSSASTITRFSDIFDRLQEIDRDIEELQRLKARLPAGRAFSQGIQISFDKAINDLLNEKIDLQGLEIEDPPEELLQEILAVDMATASRISVAHVREPEALSARDEQVRAFLEAMPKTEIHLHMEACISKETLMSMMDANGQAYEVADVDKLYQFSNLNEFIKLFLFILDAIKAPSDFEFIFGNLRSYLEANNIKYCEAFLAPSKMIQNGLDFNEIAAVLDDQARKSVREGGPDVKFLIDVSRTFGPENASQNLQRVLKAKTDSIIGIGLGGAELMGPARDFGPVFAQARAEGLRAVAHAGEDDGSWSVRDSVEILKAERIGHAISAIQDPELLDLMKERNIPIEICLTSNIFTGKYVRREADHPVRRYYDMGMPLCINTDDPEIFNVNLTDEYFKLYKHLDFTMSELTDLVRQGVNATFQSDPGAMWREFEPEIARLREVHKV